MLPTAFPIPADHPRLRELIAQLGGRGNPQRAKLARVQGKPSGCYWNVEERVRSSGGSSLLGWNLRMWPGVYLCAEHHAVWKQPNGKLLDVTPSVGSNSSADFVSFLPDDRFSVSLDRVPNIRCHYVALIKDALVADFIARYNDFHAATDALLGFYDRLNIHPTLDQPVEFELSGEAEHAYLSLVNEREAAQLRMLEARDKIAGRLKK